MRVRDGVRANSYFLSGIQMDALGDAGVVRLMEEMIATGESYVLGNHNMHSLYVWYHEPRMREFYSLADYVYIDGMLLILLGKIFGLPLKRKDRAACLDFLPSFAAQAAAHGWRIYSLGCEPGVGEKATERLRQLYPGLQIRTHHGHFNTEKLGAENQAVLSEINAYAPHLLMVGMGMPRQELWITQNRLELKANVITTTGATMDYIAGVKATPPRWLGPLYLEGFYRLITEPTRLFRRYLIEPWFVLRTATAHYLKNGRHKFAAETLK
jgi:N-acetylglucosaminyldiphosphoundecaprenol N-acetyl-beta-D-mannosaminyltransferase